MIAHPSASPDARTLDWNACCVDHESRPMHSALAIELSATSFVVATKSASVGTSIRYPRLLGFQRAPPSPAAVQVSSSVSR